MAPLMNKASADQLEVQNAGLRFAIPFEGPAPVQAWGCTSDGQRFYFRWRGRNASLTVGSPAVVQPRTAAEVWAAITGATAHEARMAVGDEPLRAGEVYPDGPCVTETTPMDDSLANAAAVLQDLLRRYELARGAN